MRTILTLLLIIAVIFIAIIIWQTTAYKVSEPKFVVEKTDGAISIRQYPPIIVAEVTQTGKRYKAINSGFRLLADYIFGGNGKEKSIAMTAPVIQSRTKIPMTAPVTQQADNDNWVIRFVMPDSYQLNELPKPDNADVKLIPIPAKTYVVIQFSGFNSESNLSQHLKQLEAYVEENKLQTLGNPIYAFYNPPWILPFLRRNEIMLELQS
tara:strand:+ start:731 stop:1357 length:627 start_codon:yes stop_codon:yes gene_type:complete